MSKKNENVLNIVRILFLALMLVSYYLPHNIIKNLNKTSIRIVLMVIIIGVCLLDPICSLLLAIALILMLQKLQDKKNEKYKNNTNQLY